MKRISMVLALGAVVGGAFVAGVSYADGDGEGLPAGVREAVQKAYPQGKIKDTERERVALKVYEVQLKNGDDELEVVVAEDGTIVCVETKIARDKLPAAVEATLAKQAGKAKIRKIEHKETRARLGFVPLATPEVAFEAEWEHHEILIGNGGNLLNGDDDDDDDHGQADDDDDDDDDDHGRMDDDDDDDDDHGRMRGDDDDDDDDDHGKGDDDDDDDDDD